MLISGTVTSCKSVLDLGNSVMWCVSWRFMAFDIRRPMTDIERWLFHGPLLPRTYFICLAKSTIEKGYKRLSSNERLRPPARYDTWAGQGSIPPRSKLRHIQCRLFHICLWQWLTREWLTWNKVHINRRLSGRFVAAHVHCGWMPRRHCNH